MKAPKYDTEHTQQWSSRAGRSEVGRTMMYITCPFCKTEVLAHAWSLAGRGKLCPGCGAIHSWWGWTAQRLDPKSGS